MELIIENVKSLEDKKLLIELVNRLGFKVSVYDPELEDEALARAMLEAKKGKMFSKEEALKYLGDD
ncbi:MAG: hypothetical protein SFW35_01555 [Chitinophagales bacterium]|nr:hypothetical protein [Chitinophagales bacterium]